MGKFKVGDRVRVLPRDKALAFSGHGATAGKEYTVKAVRGNAGDNIDTELWSFFDHEIELVPSLTIEPGKHYRTRSGKPTGRVTKGDTGFEAVIDGKVRIYDAAGGHVHGDADLDIVEAWVPRVGERVRFVRDNTDGGAEYGAKGEVVTVMRVISGVASSHVDVSSSRFDWWPGASLSDLEPLPVAAEAQPAAPMKIEAGRYYKTRDGRKVGPLVTTDDNEYWPFKWPEQTMYYRVDGYSCPGSRRLHRDQDDLIAEWPETANVGAQVDTLAEEYGPARAATTSDDDDIVEMSIGELTMAIADALRVVGKKTAKKPVKIGDAVTLSAPARIAGIDKKNAMVVLDTGGSFALPLAALRAA